MNHEPKLPRSLQEVADVIGRDKALRLVANLPRMKGDRQWRVFLYVPVRLKPDHLLVRMLGWNDAERMVRAFTGMILELATCKQLQIETRYQIVRQLSAEGKTRQQIAEAVNLSPRRVAEILTMASAPEDSHAANDNVAEESQTAGNRGHDRHAYGNSQSH